MWSPRLIRKWKCRPIKFEDISSQSLKRQFKSTTDRRFQLEIEIVFIAVRCVLSFKDNLIDLIVSKSIDRAGAVLICQERDKQGWCVMEQVSGLQKMAALPRRVSPSPSSLSLSSLMKWAVSSFPHSSTIYYCPPGAWYLFPCSRLCFSTHTQFLRWQSASSATLSHSAFNKTGPSLQRAGKLSAAVLTIVINELHHTGLDRQQHICLSAVLKC